MIPNLTKGAGIKGTALYVLHDERTESEKALGHELTPEHQTAHRVGFTATRNLSTDDPELAWRLMCATAASQDQLKAAAGVHKGGRRTEKFCGHLSLSWEHGARVDQAEMERAADGALASLGWQKLQALIVEHRDHDHAHCHIVVNLIDPETGKAAPNAKGDYDKLQRWAHAYEVERGQIVCPDRAKRMEAQERGEKAHPDRKWLPRQAWEAERAAQREAQQQSRSEALTETKERIKTSSAEVRDRHRVEWRELYQQQRQEARALERRRFEQSRQLSRSIVKPEARAAFFNRYRDELWRAHGDKSFATTEALLCPRRLTEAVMKAQAEGKRSLADRHAAQKDALSEKVQAARHDAHRAIWQEHRGRQGPPDRPAQLAAQPKPATSAEQALRRYADQRLAAEAAQKARVAARRDAAVDTPAPDQKPANTNEQEQRAAEFLARYAAQRQHDQYRRRDRDRER